MRYLLLVNADESAFAAFSPEEQAAGLAAYTEWSEALTRRGVLKGMDRLRPSAETTNVQVRDGELITTDGPFIETKEQLGGYFLIECKDRAEAIEIASKCPGAHHGTVEVRETWDM